MVQNFKVVSQVHLLEQIKSLRASVGDGLNDEEFTQLLHVSSLPQEFGFTFLSYSGGFLAFNVPPQDLNDWYAKNAWIHSTRERLAKAIAEKYSFTLFEPPDVHDLCLNPQHELSTVRHHIEFVQTRESIIIAHPRYLKIRVGRLDAVTLMLNRIPVAQILDSGLLRDLSILYQVKAPRCDKKELCRP